MHGRGKDGFTRACGAVRRTSDELSTVGVEVQLLHMYRSPLTQQQQTHPLDPSSACLPRLSNECRLTPLAGKSLPVFRRDASSQSIAKKIVIERQRSQSISDSLDNGDAQERVAFPKPTITIQVPQPTPLPDQPTPRPGEPSL